MLIKERKKVPEVILINKIKIKKKFPILKILVLPTFLTWLQRIIKILALIKKMKKKKKKKLVLWRKKNQMIQKIKFIRQ